MSFPEPLSMKLDENRNLVVQWKFDNGQDKGRYIKTFNDFKCACTHDQAPHAIDNWAPGRVTQFMCYDSDRCPVHLDLYSKYGESEMRKRASEFMRQTGLTNPYPIAPSVMK